jgi:cytochrome c nitrite reductase small subunit
MGNPSVAAPRFIEGNPQSPGSVTRSTLLSIFFAAALGVFCGVGLFTFGYGKGYSYLMSNPMTCTNCHVMQANYDSWEQSSHRHVAVCNDCHLPHNLLGHLVTEADNGFCHSLAFTLENFHEPIQIKPRNRRVTQGACLSCHATTVHEMAAGVDGAELPLCVHCHQDVGHAFH